MELLHCPFCGNDLMQQKEEETIYSLTRVDASSIYNIVCLPAYGGCDASILGDSVEDCIKKWNSRKYDISG